jgi:hypothetical protein
MENQQLTVQTAQDLTAGPTGKTGTVGADWHQIDTKTLNHIWARLRGLNVAGQPSTLILTAEWHRSSDRAAICDEFWY